MNDAGFIADKPIYLMITCQAKQKRAKTDTLNDSTDRQPLPLDDAPAGHGSSIPDGRGGARSR